jgi:hypothetical protein
VEKSGREKYITAPANGKESSHSAHANGMNEYQLAYMQLNSTKTQFCFYLFLKIHKATSQFIHRLRVFENRELFKASVFYAYLL